MQKKNSNLCRLSISYSEESHLKCTGVVKSLPGHWHMANFENNNIQYVNVRRE